MVGILYCRNSHLNHSEIETILENAGIPSCSFDFETVDAQSISKCDLLINAMGPYYVSDKMHLLTGFIAQKKSMIHLAPMPFTKDLDNLAISPENQRILRSFYYIDDFSPIPETSSYVLTFDGYHVDVQLSGLTGAVYHLSKRDQTGTYHDAYLEHILDAYASDGTFLAAPVIRVVPYSNGSSTYFNFNLDHSILSVPFWSELFVNVVKKELLGNVHLTVDCDYARYTPDETQNVSIKLESINLDVSEKLSLLIQVSGSNGEVVFKENRSCFCNYETVVSLNLMYSDLYKVEVSVCSAESNLLIVSKTTGYVVISEEELICKVSSFSPMYIDESISTDFCLLDGQTVATLGTTYFVTDEYRRCFYYMNAWRCAEEMAALKKLGFNVLRSGNWQHMERFYNEDGSISKRGIRALQVYFLTAAANGFTVQFTLGNVMLNQWDESLSPIYNEKMREKCMIYVRSFAETFKEYKNVCLDIVNEPSYSRKGAWAPARPAGDPEELTAFRSWLAQKYNGNFRALINAWAENPGIYKCFDDIQMPTGDMFSRWFNRIDHRVNYASLADFYIFARENFLDWTAEVRRNIKNAAPNMIVTMGRDECLRIPSQQDEVLAGNIDMVCWHQWHKNSDIITEYLLNRVRGKLCIAQEMGMYKYDDVRGGKRYSDREMVTKLGKKLLYSFGNFVQWQAHDDPYMYELSENSLGLIRADLSPTPSLDITKRLNQAEKNMQHLMHHRDETKTKILSVYNTSYYFSVDQQVALQSLRTHVSALYNYLGEMADFLPEHLFTKENASAIGNPKLIILPGMQNLSKDAWQLLLQYVEKGATLLVSGCIDKDAFFRDDAKIKLLDNNYVTRKLLNFEKLVIDGTEYIADFRQIVDYCDVSNGMNCGQIGGEATLYNGSSTISEYEIGKGLLLYCPYPLEFASTPDVLCALYRYAINRAHAESEVYRITEKAPNVVFSGIPYQECTVYTLTNEGFATDVSWIDLRSGKEFNFTVKADGGCKIWLSPEGEVLQYFEI